MFGLHLASYNFFSGGQQIVNEFVDATIYLLGIEGWREVHHPVVLEPAVYQRELRLPLFLISLSFGLLRFLFLVLVNAHFGGNWT